MRKTVGYFEGTDSPLLTSLICDGYDTIPISNGYDSHGAHVRMINQESQIDLLVGYLHKVYAPEGAKPGVATYQDIFHVCRTFGVPLLLEIPTELHAKAGAILGDVPDVVRFVDPSEMLDTARAILSGNADA
jgi:hypothetical protein